MFRIMKFLHHARENGYPDIAVEEASVQLLTEIDNQPSPHDLLVIFRRIDRYPN